MRAVVSRFGLQAAPSPFASVSRSCAMLPWLDGKHSEIGTAFRITGNLAERVTAAGAMGAHVEVRATAVARSMRPAFFARKAAPTCGSRTPTQASRAAKQV